MENLESLPKPKEVQTCIDWLSKKKLITTKSVSFNSSCIKVRVEQEMKTYVSKQAVVEALIKLGILFKKIPGSATVEVFLLKKEIFGR